MGSGKGVNKRASTKASTLKSDIMRIEEIRNDLEKKDILKYSLLFRSSEFSMLKNVDAEEMGSHYVGEKREIYSREEIDFILSEAIRDLIAGRSYGNYKASSNEIKEMHEIIGQLDIGSISVKIDKTQLEDGSHQYRFDFVYGEAILVREELDYYGGIFGVNSVAIDNLEIDDPDFLEISLPLSIIVQK